MINRDRGGTASSTYHNERGSSRLARGMGGSDGGNSGAYQRGLHHQPHPEERIQGTIRGGQQEQRDVVDDEEERRVRKNEEILKNIERARKRREEEENKYKFSRDFMDDEVAEDGCYGRFKESGASNSRHEYGSRNRRRSPACGSFDMTFNGKEEIESITNGSSSLDSRDQRLKYPHSPTPHRSNRASGSPPGPSVADETALAVAPNAPAEVTPSDLPTTPPPPQQRFKRLGGELLQSNMEQIQHQQRHRSGNSGDRDEHAKTSNAWGRTGRSSKQRDQGALFKPTDFDEDDISQASPVAVSHKSLIHGSDDSPIELDREKSVLDEGESSAESYSSHEKSTESRDPRGQQRKRPRRQKPGELPDHTIDECATEEHLQLLEEKDRKHMRTRDEPVANKVSKKTRAPTAAASHSFEANKSAGLVGFNSSKRSEGMSTLSNNKDGGKALDCDKRSDGFQHEHNNLLSNYQKSGRIGTNELQKEGGVVQRISAGILEAKSAKVEADTSPSEVGDAAFNGGGAASACGSGWFVPRGQPSRRGRGASSATVGGRLTAASSKGKARNVPDDDYNKFVDLVDSNEDAFTEIAEVNEDELSSGLRRDDAADMAGGRRSSGREKNRRNKQDLREANEEFVGDDDDNIQKKPGRLNGNKFEGPRRGIGKGSDEGGRLMSRNTTSQQQFLQQQHQQQHQPQHGGSTGNMFERRQNKLPPRLAKQREQNRVIQKGQQHIQLQQQHPPGQGSHNQDPSTDIIRGADGGWGGGDGLALVNENSYGTAGWAKYETSVQATMNTPSTDNLANMFEQMGKGPPISCTVGGQPNTAGLGATNVAQKLLAAAAASQDGSEQGVIGHSGTGKHNESPGDHHVQTIIFENTNFKGGPPGTRVVASGEVSVGSSMGTHDKSITPAVVAATQQLQFASKCSEPGFKSDAVAAGGGVQSGPGMHIPGLSFPHKSSRKHDNAGTPDLKIDFASFNSEMSVPVGSASAAAAAAAAAVAATSTSGGSSGINDQQHLPSKSSHTAEELNMKIASVKKVWDTHCIGDQQQNGSGGAVFAAGSGFQNESGTGAAANCRSKTSDQFSKVDVTTGVSNKSRLSAEGVGGVTAYPTQHPALPHQPLSHMQAHQSGSSADYDHRNSQRSIAAMAAAAAAAVSGNSGNNAVSVHQGVPQSAVSGNSAASMAFSRLGLSALPSPPSILGNQAVAAAVAAAAQQPQSIYQTFQLDGRSAAAAAAVTNQLYPAYAAAAGMGGLANDIFSAAAAGGNQYRLTPQQFQQQGHQQPLVSSQPTSMMTTALKQQHSQIGPIGTKGNQGGGHFQPQQHQPPPQSGLGHGNGGGASGGGSGVGGGGGSSQGGLGGLPVTASSPLLIQYDAAAAAAAAGNYLPSALQRSAAAAALHGHHQGLQNPPPPPQGGQTAFYQALSTQQHAAAAIQAATAAVAANQGRQQHQQQQNAAAAAAAVAAFASGGGSGGGSGAGLHGFHANGNFNE